MLLYKELIYGNIYYTKLWTISRHSTPLECKNLGIGFSIDISLLWSMETEILKRYDTESNEVFRNLRFLLTDLAPNETVKIEEMRDFGGRIVIAELEVVPRKDQPLNDTTVRDR